MNCFVIKELEAKNVADGVEMRVISGEKMTMVFFNLDKGVEIPEHSHPHEQMGTVMRGSVELVVGREKRTVKKGGAYHIPSNAVHSGRCLEASSEVLEVFSPPREDLKA